MDNNFLYTEKLAVGYSGKIIIDNINLSVKQGQITTLIGPNGAGKSTILKSIIRQLEKISGAVFIDGKNSDNISGKELAKIMSVLMTERMEAELMTCADTVKTGRYPYTGQLGILSDNDKIKVSEAMDLTHVTEISDQNFNRISDGQRQRVMLARAICQEPDILVLDEPTSFLDIRHKLEMLNILKMLVREKNIAVIMSMHELDLAQRISDYIVCIGENGIDKYGTPDEIFTAEYIGRLYGITPLCYDENYGTAELEMPKGIPQIFVIAGGGTGIKTFRKLQRLNIPFITGVIHENDIDFPAAKALAAEVISEKSFEPISDKNIEKAAEKIDLCRGVICCTNNFGTMNMGNKKLKEYAQKQNKLKNAY